MRFVTETGKCNFAIEGHKKIGRLSCCIVLGISLSQGLWAQTSTEDRNYNLNESDARIEEVVVTATRRETGLQDTPIAITALSGLDLDEGGMTDLRNIALETPSMFIGGNDGFGSYSVNIRGIGSLAIGVGAEEGVGVYVDGVYQGKPYGSVFEFAGIERIEVLRGPQGTLYGRNATGGAINIVSSEPSHDFHSTADVQITEFDGLRFRGTATGSLVGNKLGGSIAIARSTRDGYANNPVREEDVYDKQQNFLSGALRWTPSDRTKVILRSYFGNTDSSYAFKNVIDGLDLDTIPANFKSFDTRDFFSISATIDHQFENMAFKSITAYVEGDVQNHADTDGSPNDEIEYRSEFSNRQVSQEFRLVSTASGSFQWIIGGVLFAEEGDAFIPFDLPAIPIGLLFAADVETKSYSGYFEGSYDFTDRLTFTAGVGYTHETKDWRGCRTFYTDFDDDFVPTLCEGSFVPDDASWDELTPKVVLDYRVSDNVFLYTSATHGFRSGGWNMTDPTLPGGNNNFNPESVWSYEGGVKTDLLDQKLRLNITGFYADYTDIQVRVTDPVTNLINTKNAADAEIYGIELELFARPVDGLSFNTTASWLDATYKSFSFIQTDGTPVDHSGNRLNRSPEWKVSFVTKYDIPIDGRGILTPRVEYNYVGETFYSELNRPFQGTDSFEIINLRLRFEHESGRWGLQAFLDNAGDERYREHVSSETPTRVAATISRPRMWGVEVFFDW